MIKRKGFETFNGCVGKNINKIYLDDNDRLIFEFADGVWMALIDDGQSCCESRYMSTDDNFVEFEGAKLLDIELKDWDDVSENDYIVHEIQFLDIKTDKGIFTIANHNEHNGYYSGFVIDCMIVTREFVPFAQKANS